MANNINCTCGHSWSKASSSKKDMYVCHMCGKDNTMKDGGWLDNYGKKPNPNDVEVSTGPGFVGLGYDTTGRNYSPAWGGQFQSGGFLEPISYKLPSRYRIPYAEPSSELAMSIGGEGGEPAYLIPSFKGGKELKDPIAEYRKTGEHLGGPFKTWQEADKWEQEIRHPYVEKGKPIPTPLKRWGDMQDGGNVAQGGKSIPTMADSLALYNTSKKVLDYYKDKKYKDYSNIDYKKKKDYKHYNKQALEQFIKLNKSGGIKVPTDGGKKYEIKTIPVDSYYKKLDANRYLQRERFYGALDTKAPMQLFDNRITPTLQSFYANEKVDDPLYEDNVSIYSYDPILVKPVSMLTSKERALRLKRYGKESGLTDEKVKVSTSTEKSKTEPVVKKSEETKLTKPTKTEETKPTPSTPKGSKKYILNGMEVSEEDFLGSGNTTGGSKRIIYSTPKIKDRKVLRLDGTPETDPEKIRKAMRAQEKDDDMAMGGTMQYGGSKATTDSVRHQADKILKYEQLRGGPGGAPLPYYSDPKYMDMLMNKVYPEVRKIMPGATAMEAGEAMDFVFNAGFDQNTNKITKDPRAFALQEYYRQYDSSKLDADGKWSGRKNPAYSFDQEYANTIGKLSENERRTLMNKGRDWYYRNINNPAPGVPNSNYDDTWYGRIWNTNDFLPFDPKNPKFTPKKQMGGSLPGAVGFTYARTAGSAPSNGKYAKKTKASAQNGKEMKFYQEGLDFKPNSIAQDGGAIVDPMGQWAHPGEVTIIPSTDITMEGVDYPVLGISDTGDQQMMYPGEDYDFDGDYVTEYPMMKQGGWLSKFDTAQSGGTFMNKVDADIAKLLGSNTDKNRSSGDIASYFSEIKRMQEKPKNEKAIIKNEQKIKKQRLADAVANARGKQATVKQDDRTSREKEIAQKQLLDLKMDEARSTSPFTQTLSSFTPTGSNQAAGQIAAENIGQMTPMMGATRLFTTLTDPENNPYGIGQGNGFLANTLGTLGLLGDAFDVGAITNPAIASGLKRFTNKPSPKVNQLDNSGKFATEIVDPETGISKFVYELDNNPVANNYQPAKGSDFTGFQIKLYDKAKEISNAILDAITNKRDYSKPLTTLESYKNWARFIHPELEFVDPKIIKQIHKEGIKALNKTSGLSKNDDVSREFGLYIRDRLADKIPSFADPVVTHPTTGKFMTYGPNQLHPNVLSKDELSIFEQIYKGDEQASLHPQYRDLSTMPVKDWGYDINKLDAQELNLIDAYARGYDQIMNARGSNQNVFNTSKFYQDKAEQLNQAIQKNKFPEATTVRRGSLDYELELLDPETLKPTGKKVKKSELKVGDVFKDEEFLSTSIGQEHTIGTPTSSELVEIPGGGVQSYAYPNAASGTPFPNELEAILPKGLIRRVEEVRSPSSVDMFSNVNYPNNAKYRTKILNPYNLLLPLGGAALFGKEEKENGGWLTKYK